MKSIRNEVVILDPKSVPVRALNSAMDQASLGPSEWAQLDNLRIEKGLLTCRGGTSTIGSIVSAASYRGHWEGNLWNGYTVIVAAMVSAEVRIYESTDLISWTEITAASGKYGNTRFTDTDRPVRFTVVPRTFGTEDGVGSILIAVNGVDDARAFTSAGCSIVEDIEPPTKVQDKTVYVSQVPSGFFLNIQAIVGGDLSATGAGITWTVNGADPDLQARLTITSGVTSGSTATITRTISNVTTSALNRQLLIGVDTAYGQLWDKLKIECNALVVWDGFNPASYTRPIPVFLDNSQRIIWVFELPTIAGTTNITTFKLTWTADTAEAPSASQIADFFMIAIGYGGGLMKSDASLGVSSVNSGSGTESPGVVYSTYQTVRVKDVGGPVLSDVRLPRSPVINAVFSAPVVGVSDTERDKGVNRVNFYVKETGSTRYRYHYSQALTSWGGASWTHTNPSAEDLFAWTTAGPDTYDVIYPDVDIPSAFNKAIPTDSTEVCWANNRLLVGGIKTDNLAISEYKLPFRTTLVPRFENGRQAEQSGTYLSLEGETVQAIHPIAASTAGSSTIFVFTDKNIYAVSGQETSQLSQLGRIANIGTPAPLSIASDKGTVYFVDQEGQVRVLDAGSIQSITRSVVDDKLQSVPGDRRKWLCGVVWKDRYYLSYSESTTNNRILVWDMDAGMWTTDTPPIPFDCLLTWIDNSTEELRFVGIGLLSTTLIAYDYDLVSAIHDLGENISCILEPYELHSQDGGMFHVGRCKAMIDDMIGRQATIVRTYYPSEVYQTTTLSIDADNEHIYREDRIEGATVTGTGQPVGPRCRVVFTIPLHADFKIRYLSLETTSIGGGQDRP